MPTGFLRDVKGVCSARCAHPNAEGMQGYAAYKKLLHVSKVTIVCNYFHGVCSMQPDEHTMYAGAKKGMQATLRILKQYTQVNTQ